MTDERRLASKKRHAAKAIKGKPAQQDGSASARPKQRKPDSPPSPFNVAMGRRIRLTYELRGMEQGDVCAILDVNQSRFSKWVTGKHQPDLEVMAAFVARFRVTLNFIAYGQPAGSNRKTIALIRAIEPELVQPDSIGTD